MKPMKKALKHRIQAFISFVFLQEAWFLLYEISLLHQSQRRAAEGIHPLLKVRIQFKKSNPIRCFLAASSAYGFTSMVALIANSVKFFFSTRLKSVLVVDSET